jgi:hypothetical protein
MCFTAAMINAAIIGGTEAPGTSSLTQCHLPESGSDSQYQALWNPSNWINCPISAAGGKLRGAEVLCLGVPLATLAFLNAYSRPMVAHECRSADRR